MHLNKSLSALALLTLISTSAWADEGPSGIIHFTGDIINPSCKIVGEGGTTDSTVKLGSYPPSTFSALGEKSTNMKFVLTLKDCPVATDGLDQIQLTFSGDTVPGSDDVLALDAASTAGGVGISVVSENDKTLNLNMKGEEGQLFIPLMTSAGNITTNLFARFQSIVATPAEITPGTASSQMIVNIVYH